MRKLIVLLLLILASSIPARAQSLYESAEELKIELRDLHQAKQLDATPFIPPLARIYELEEELRPTGFEERAPLGQRCERAIKVSELFASVVRLRAVRIKSRRARERLKPFFAALQSSVQGYGPGDEDGSCKRLKGVV